MKPKNDPTQEIQQPKKKKICQICFGTIPIAWKMKNSLFLSKYIIIIEPNKEKRDIITIKLKTKYKIIFSVFIILYTAEFNSFLDSIFTGVSNNLNISSAKSSISGDPLTFKSIKSNSSFFF